MGAVEEAVAQLWAELLGLEAVSRTDSFFALGGDSLLATRLNQAISTRFGVELTLRQMFTDPTVAGLASLVAEFDQAAIEEGVL